MIVQKLFELQHRHSFLPQEEMRALSERHDIPLYRLQEVASFFPHFRLIAPAKVHVQVCHDMACHLRGACELKRGLERFAAGAPAGQVKVDDVSCLGRCDRAPAALINEALFAGRTLDELIDASQAYLSGNAASPDRDADVERHSAQPWEIDVYRGQPAYAAIKKFMSDIAEEKAGNPHLGAEPIAGPAAPLQPGIAPPAAAAPGSASPQPPPAVQRVLDALKAAGLRGMGGAGTPAWEKWKDVWRAKGNEKYIVCNADESEPSTFKDRELLLRTPHLVLEGVILAGLMTQATQGYIYIRHEYQEQIAVMRDTIQQACRMGVCGDRILGTDRSFPVEVFVSPGGYICGEQSALIEAMEDNRAQPRNKPPQLATNGLRDKPTLLSNVETFAWVPAIIEHGGEWYTSQGRPGFKGRRFFSVCGDVERPGAYEVPVGTLVRDLLNMAGGMRSGMRLKAVAMSGPSGGFLPARMPLAELTAGWEKRVPAQWREAAAPPGAVELDILDLPLDIDVFRALGPLFMLGAGIVIYGEGADMVSQALNCVEFFQKESCGKCVPCRIGSQKAVQIATDLHLQRITRPALGRLSPVVDELFSTMALTSICGLGQVAAQPLVTLLRYFADDVNACLPATERPPAEEPAP